MNKLLLSAVGALSVVCASTTLYAANTTTVDKVNTPPHQETAATTAKTTTDSSTVKTTSSTTMSQKQQASYAIGYEVGDSVKKQSDRINPTEVAKGLSDGLSGKQEEPPKSADGKPGKDQFSYIAGYRTGANFKTSVDATALQKGFSDAVAGKKSELTPEETKQAMQQFTAEMNKEREATGKVNAEKGKAYLEKISKEPGVQKLGNDGLYYKVIKQGSGPIPKSTDTVKVEYTGKLIDGTVFDSTAKHGGKPATFPVNAVIKGWTQALEKMPVGSEWTLYIPSDLAYGANGAGASIPPNSTLIFDVKLLGIEAKK
ncbi:MAG: FKBP-type peptidyl-prolyl cis-trans isomerase [Pseudomonadota bacterium]